MGIEEVLVGVKVRAVELSLLYELELALVLAVSWCVCVCVCGGGGGYIYIHENTGTCTVEPLNNVTFGTSYSVEVPFFGGYKCVSTIGK